MSLHAELVRHAASPACAVAGIGVDVAQGADGWLRLRYRVTGDIRALRLAAPHAPQRADGLWQHSCFETFLRAAGASAYFEFHFAPSGAWAGYRFAARRDGRTDCAMPAPQILAHQHANGFLLEAAFDRSSIAELATAELEAGISAVIEDAQGALSYWALAHAGSAPDFHDPAGFRMRLPAR